MEKDFSSENQDVLLVGDDIPLIDIDQGLSTVFTGFGSLDPLIKTEEFHVIKRSASQPNLAVSVSSKEPDAPFAQLPMVRSLMNITDTHIEETNEAMQIIRCWKM
ncbi:hypothetical protein GPJ56_008764 [Histomonas meleagridis]|uniref:uncharacterized protein n=1 Tax=Histomonas meleagridis TaxID=135588 RepID=UPI00355A6739|nr:hypothetical protein GPJ56_008764 [Histomonas meleagridis]KAH0805445.1 hypothetical protein GO595_001827 [Histomonas meleagridis]